MAAFKKWRHDVELFIETIDSSWKGFSRLLKCSRFLEEEFTQSNLGKVLEITTKINGKSAINEYMFNFHDKLHKLVMPRLSAAFATDFWQIGSTNGGGLF